MAKKALENSDDEVRITSAGFTLQISRIGGDPTTVDLSVFDEDGTRYGLQAEGLADRKALVKKILGVIADYWQDFNWQFTAGKTNTITKVFARGE